MDQTKLTKAQVRLELLKLTFNNVHTVEVIVEKTKKLEEFILEEDGKTEIQVADTQGDLEKGKGNKKPIPSSNKKDDKLFT